MEVKAEVHVSNNEIYTNIHLNYSGVEFFSCKKFKKKKRKKGLIYSQCLIIEITSCFPFLSKKFRSRFRSLKGKKKKKVNEDQISFLVKKNNKLMFFFFFYKKKKEKEPLIFPI